MTSPALGGAQGSARLKLTKNPRSLITLTFFEIPFSIQGRGNSLTLEQLCDLGTYSSSSIDTIVILAERGTLQEMSICQAPPFRPIQYFPRPAESHELVQVICSPCEGLTQVEPSGTQSPLYHLAAHFTGNLCCSSLKLTSSLLE